jgi:KUP system potassium uptake protein
MARETKVEGTAVYLSRRVNVVPVAMLHNVKHYHVLHERNVILSVETEQVPRVAASERASVTDLGHGFHRVVLIYGFMEHPDIPAALDQCKLADEGGFDLMQTSFFLSRVSVADAGADRRSLNPLFRHLFAWMHRNEVDATEFFRIPRNRIVELGARIEI